MKYYCLLFYIIDIASQKKTTDVTLNVNDRIYLLKRQIAEQIKDKQRMSELILPINTEDDEYTYVDIDKKPITPINDFDQRKEKEKFKLREIITTTPTEETPHVVARTQKNVARGRRHKFRVAKPVDSFYRRSVMADQNTQIRWIHCQDMFSPFYSGIKKDLTHPKRLTVNDHSVLRLLELLNLNTTGHTKEEIYSVLYQISNLQIRLFQWDISAITSLINVIIKDTNIHTFKNLIRGIKRLLGSWHLDFANTTNLLKQAKIFRPPCVKVSNYEGSTKTSHGYRYTKSTTPKPTCSSPSDKGCTDKRYT